MTHDNSKILKDHLATLGKRWEFSMARHNIDLAIVHAGNPQYYLFDDQASTFRANPHIAQWLHTDACQGSILTISTTDGAKLYFLQQTGYWEKSASPPREDSKELHVVIFNDQNTLIKEVKQQINRHNFIVHIGNPEKDLESSGKQINPTDLITTLDYYRAYKTPFEIAAMKQASIMGVKGHLAAKNAFYSEASEMDIHLAYLKASRQTEESLPYPNIIALNEHGSILHYQYYEPTPPPVFRSFLIDAGARSNNYAADITRTYVKPNSKAETQIFEGLIDSLNNAQKQLISQITPGVKYLDLHDEMHRKLAEILLAAGLVKSDPEETLAFGITRSFLPHGLGHLLGLQTHDVGGHQIDLDGNKEHPPEYYESLRLTRTVEEDQIFTIEPGIYFIPMLLAELKGTKQSKYVNWNLVDALVPFGGIRIEDNILLKSNGIENLTRIAFSQASEQQ